MEKNKKYILLILILFSGLVNAQSLKPGDGIKITFYNIEDPIQGQYIIEQDNMIQLPFLGEISTINKDFETIKLEILEKYFGIYKNPEITIQPLIRVGVLGEVNKPGIYYLTGTESFADLLALAGGETKDSDIDDIRIIRKDEQLDFDLDAYIEGNVNLLDYGLKSGDQIYVSRSWWVDARNVSIIISGASVLVALAALFTK